MDGLYFFGGYQRKQGTYFNDLFYFDLDKNAVLYEGSMYIFGGYDGRARFNDLYKCKLR